MVTWSRRGRWAVEAGPARLVGPSGPVVAAAVACAVLAGCAGAGASATTGGGSSGSRHHLYGSVAEMLDDSDLVLSGTAGAQRVVAESPGSALASTLTDLAVDDVVRAGDGTTAGSTVVVRQVTTAPGWTSSEPDAPLLPGERYLLFLVRSGLPGDAAAQLYPVGAVAGIYRDDGDGFVRLVPGSGDTLPLSVTAEALRR